MKLNTLRGFLAVVENGSIRSAARAIGMSQPALTKAIRQLEDELAVQLVQRTTRGVIPTKYGAALRKRAHLIDGELRKAIEEIDQMRGDMVGEVAFGVSPSAAIRLIPEALQSFRRAHPKVRIRIVDGLYPAVLSNVRDGNLDFVLGPLPSQLPGNEFASQALYNNELVVSVREGHPLARSTSLKQLMNANWIFTGLAGSPGMAIERTFVENKLTPPKSMLESESFTALISLIVSSDYVCLLPRQLVELPQMKGILRRVSIKEVAAQSVVGLIMRADSPLTPAAQKLVTHVQRVAGRLS